MADNTREELRARVQTLFYRVNPELFIHDEVDEVMTLIQSEITKAQEQLLDELLSKRKVVDVGQGIYDYRDAVLISDIEAKLKAIKEGK